MRGYYYGERAAATQLAQSDFQKATLAVYSCHAVQANGDGWRFYFSTDASLSSGWTLDGVAFYALAARP